MPNFAEVLTVGNPFTSFTVHPEITGDKIVEVFSSSLNGVGVFSNSIGAGIGIRGTCADGTGVSGESNTAQGFLAGRDPIFHESAGAFGQSDQAGVFGNSEGVGGTGVHGRGGAAGSFGVRGEITGSGHAAIKGEVFGPGNALAGEFIGSIKVTGDAEVKGDIRLINADCAENFSTSPDSPVDPGTVVVLGDEGQLFPSTMAYDKRVAGVVSGAGSFRPGIILDNAIKGPRQPVALLGKVYCKADASYGSIEVGDLLTTSATDGHAMKATDHDKAFGAVIGKALRPLREGKDLIPILIALQ